MHNQISYVNQTFTRHESGCRAAIFLQRGLGDLDGFLVAGQDSALDAKLAYLLWPTQAYVSYKGHHWPLLQHAKRAMIFSGWAPPRRTSGRCA